MTGGVLRGAGKQLIGALCNLVGYYFIGFPIGVSLMFAAKMGIIGKSGPLMHSSAIVLYVVLSPAHKLTFKETIKTLLIFCKRTMDRTYHLCVNAIHFLRHIYVQTRLEEGC